MTQSETPAQNDTLQFSQAMRDLTGMTLGDFEVERLLGHGGMGEVYLARQVSLNRPVALKVLRPEMLSNPTYLARFESEAWAAATLSHPNIVHIYTLGSIDGLRFIAMEYVAGTNLREYLARRGIPELPLALSIMKQAAVGVGAAGEAGLVHRDIKPENLLLTRKGQVKVADFGLCRAPETERLHLTQPGVTLGTPMYMSPEQVQGQALDHRSDLYSLGVTFYHMLSGEPPFRAETGLALALKHVREAPVSLAVHRPDLPPELVALVMKLMEKDPNRRYQSAGEMLRDLSKIRESVNAASAPLATQGVVAAPAVPSGPVLAKAPAPAPGCSEAAAEALGPGGWTMALVAAATLLVGAFLGWRARAEDLLSPGAPGASGPPGLWMADWSQVARKPSAPAQYRFAQTGAVDDPEAAWLAVPGYFPTGPSAEWSSRAYTQLARHLLRHNDADRLEGLAADLERSKREHNQALGRIARAAAAALRDDAQEVNSQLSSLSPEKLDASLAEFALEAVLRAGRGRVASTDAQALNRLRTNLMIALRVEALEQLNLLRVE
jgi:hypothetical protein